MMPVIRPPRLGPAVPTITAYVTARSGLNLRTGPSTSAPIFCAIAYGDAVQVAADPMLFGSDGWLEATYGSQSGYVAAKWVSLEKPPVDKRSDFDKAIDFVLRWEGGLVNDPADPGGLTNFGISQRAYPDLDIRNLTRKQAIAIYERDYWQRSDADQLHWPLNLVVFDSAVNAGVGKAQQWLESSGGHPMRYLGLRLDFYTHIDTWQRFGMGWARRVADLLIEMGKA